MTKTRIDRATWRYGKSSMDNPTALLGGDGYRCCLGFWCQQRGVADEYLQDTPAPCDLFPDYEGNIDKEVVAPLTFVDMNTEFSERAMNINDASEITNEERERQLIKLAAEHGETWRFYGEYRHD